MEYKLVNLLEDIKIQENIKNIILRIDSEIDYSNYQSFIIEMTNSKTSENSYLKLKALLNEDYHQYKMLTIQLETARRLYSQYKKLKIDKSIYIDTFSTFTRFIEECKEKTNEYYFDRGWWTYRQLSLVLFRIGTLEYEFTKNKTISLHIPSNAILNDTEIDKSLDMLNLFIEKHKKEYKGCKIYCGSWLLYPQLNNLLDSNSNIIKFQKRFNIVSTADNELSYKEWLFKINIDDNRNITEYREDTSLQRKAKKYLLEGNKLGEGFGYLKKREINDK